MIAELAAYHQIRPLFASILPGQRLSQERQSTVCDDTGQRPPSTILTLNNWLKQFCAQRGYTYVDYYSAMVDSAGFLQADLADDGLHPNGKGYRVMAPIALNAIDRTVRIATTEEKEGPTL